MRSKAKVGFMRGKKTSPGRRTWVDRDTRNRAIDLSKKFHGLVPRHVHRTRVNWPLNLVLIGGCARLEYLSDKTDGEVRLYYHDFEGPAQVYAAPIAQPGGKNMLVIIGKFKITEDGIIG